MANKHGAHKGSKESPSMNKGAKNTGQSRGSGKKGEYWQEGQNMSSSNSNQNWKRGPKNGPGNMNEHPDLIPGMDDLTRNGCLPTLFARIKAIFTGGTRGGCLPKLFLLLLPLMAVGVFLFIKI